MSGAELWERLRANAPILVRAMLADMSLVGFAGGVLTLSCDKSIRTTAQSRLAELERLVSSLAGAAVTCRLTDAPRGPTRGDAHEAAAQPAGEVEIDDPVVRHAIEVFNGRIVEVKPLAPSAGEGEGS